MVVASPADQHGTELVLRSWGHHVVRHAATSGEAAIDAIERRRPDVVLVGANLSEGSGIQLVRRLLTADPGLGIVLVLGQASMHELDEAMACGAPGIVLRSGEAAELSSAVVIVGQGGRYVAPSVERGARELAQLSVLSKLR